MTPTSEEWTDAFQRLAYAITRRDLGSLVRVFDASAQVDRHGPASRGDIAGPRVDSFMGLAEITHWLLLVPRGTTFAIVGLTEVAGDGIGVIEYAVSVADFRNGGQWRAKLAADARFVWWAHQPFALTDV